MYNFSPLRETVCARVFALNCSTSKNLLVSSGSTCLGDQHCTTSATAGQLMHLYSPKLEMLYHVLTVGIPCLGSTWSPHVRLLPLRQFSQLHVTRLSDIACNMIHLQPRADVRTEFYGRPQDMQKTPHKNVTPLKRWSDTATHGKDFSDVYTGLWHARKPTNLAVQGSVNCPHCTTHSKAHLLNTTPCSTLAVLLTSLQVR